MSELPVPPDAARNPQATELVRAWLIGGDLHCSLQTDIFEDPALWGVVLADLARYLGDALSEMDGRQPAETLAAIRQRFAQELDSPSEGA